MHELDVSDAVWEARDQARFEECKTSGTCPINGVVDAIQSQMSAADRYYSVSR